MNCQDCARFDVGARQCKDGKLNPPTYAAAVEAANAYGVRAICVLNDHREKLVGARQPQFKVSAGSERSTG